MSEFSSEQIEAIATAVTWFNAHSAYLEQLLEVLCICGTALVGLKMLEIFIHGGEKDYPV